MCQFFSFCSDGEGQYLCFDWEQRKKILAEEIKVESVDSHTLIADYYGWKGKREDLLNKYEYNPLTKKFQTDYLNVQDDSERAKAWVKSLNFKKIVEPLVIKSIVNPLKGNPKNPTNYDKRLLKEWASVGASVWASVEAYISSFFKIKYKYDFSPVVKLWNRGFVPSFDGKVWRLHSGKKAKIVHIWKAK